MLIDDGEDNDGDGGEEGPDEETNFSPFLGFGRGSIGWLAGQESIFLLEVVG